MATIKITKASVDALQPSQRDTFLWDGQLKGFGVKITPRGARIYIFQYRIGGRGSPTRRHTIGLHGSPWTPHTARAAAEKIALLVAGGTDPNGLAREKKRLAVDLAFDAYAKRFLASCEGRGWSGMVERAVRLHLAPNLGSKPLHEITRSQVAALIDRIPREQLALRRNTFAVLRRLFRWAVARGDIERSPCEGMETPRPVVPRDRVLSDEELKHIWACLSGVTPAFASIVRMLLVTGQRKEEVTGLDWSEVDQSSRSWTLPRARSKNASSHVIPLSTFAMQILQQRAQSSDWPSAGLVFANGARNRFTAHAAGKRALDRQLIEAGHQFTPWRLHDLRRTVATGLQRLGVRFEVTEAVLNHLSGSRAGVAAIYQRHTWRDEKDAALQLWADHLRFLALDITAAPSSS